MSFSGGKDSTVLLDLVRQMYPEVPAVFVDTGLEYPEIRDFVKNTENVIWLKPEKNFKQVIQQYGYPIISKNVSRMVSDVKKLNQNCWAARCFDGRETGMYDMRKWKFLINSPFKISNKCCDIIKKKPIKLYDKQSQRKPYIGTMASESIQRRTAWVKQGCNAFESKRPTSTPLSFWTEQDIFQYLLKYQINYCSVYGSIVAENDGQLKTTGCNRTGCVFCMFGCHLEKEPNRFQKLKQTHPKLYEYCLRDWDKGGLGMKQVLDFIGVKYE